MIRVKKDIPLSKLEELGFKKIKNHNNCKFGQEHPMYLCFSRGIQMLFASHSTVQIIKWEDDDPRIHASANCKYRSNLMAIDMVVHMTELGYIEIY